MWYLTGHNKKQRAAFNTDLSHLKSCPKAFTLPITGFVSVILFQVLHCNLIIHKLLVQYPIAPPIAKYGQAHPNTKISELTLRKKITMYIFVQEACLPFTFLSIRILTSFLMQHSKCHPLLALSFVMS